MSAEEDFDGWAFLELMGHRRLAGRVRTVQLGGSPMVRIDVPDGDEIVTQWYAPAALYCLTPTTEEVAQKWNADRYMAPVGVLGRGGDDDEEPF